ncbi:vitellogenin-like isoform X1 [Chanos chanos]|uniref:Vitellogenin-like isoform X1 n=1 Tax=Chanos chanos TaxID=29144 RepID=A0A6J2WAB2_CHACN|nr:vitellogenin-like isoform X1 [Chanos chanos]
MRAVVLALTVALVASQQVNFVPEFGAGKTYVYRYDALVLGGLPEEGLARAGVKINSKVLISAVAENIYLLKLMDPQIYEYSGVWPRDPFAPAAKLTTALANQLHMPIKFEYANGVVGRVFAPAGVSATVLNLHRGILNILQLNLKRTQNVYELQEAGAQGICKTHYVISEDAKAQHIVVTKSKDLTNCQDRIMKDIGLAYLEKCDECQQEVQSLTGTATYNYVMKPTATGALITEASVEELHQFAPFNAVNGAAQMQAKQTLAFVEIEKNPVLPIMTDYLARGFLQYEFATEILQTPVQLLRINNAQAQIVETLQHLAAHNVDRVHEDAPLKFIQLIQLLRVSTYENLEAIWDQYKNKPMYRRWVMDAIPAVGNSAALRLIKEKFLAGELTTAEFAQALLASVHMVVADLDAVNLYSSLALNHKIKEHPVLREAAMLGYGTMIAKYCAAAPNCPAELLRPIHEIAAEAIAKADIPQITLAIKTLGNAGHPASLKPILKLLPGFGSAAATLPIGVQIDAVLALRNIAKKEPRLIQPVALQLFMDRGLNPELRMVSYIGLFETKPSVALVATVVGALRKETNMQLVSFAHSYMKSMTRSIAPDMASVASACNVAIRILSPKLNRLNMRYSKGIRVDTYQSPFMAGAAGSAFLINDAATILPRAVVAKARAYLAGAAADVLEVGVRTDGLQEALLKSPLADVNVDRITRMKRTLRALKDWKALPTNQPLASFYIKLLGQEVAFANIDKAIVEQAVQLAKGARAQEMIRNALAELQSGVALQYAKPILAGEVRRIFPTATGLPMELSTYTAAVAGATINVQAVINPPLPETIRLAELLNTDIQLQAEVRPSAAVQTFAVMGVNTAFIQAALIARGKVQAIVPAKVAARANILKGNFKVEALPVSTPDHVVAVRYETLAVARNIEDVGSERITPIIPAVVEQQAQQSSEIVSPDWPSQNDPNMRAAAPIRKNICGVIPYVGIQACLDAATSNTAINWKVPYLNLLGQHAASLSVLPAEGPAVERLEMEVQIGPKAAEKLLKQINIAEEGIPGAKSILMKLREIVEAGMRNNTYSSSSSSSSEDQAISISSSQSSSSSSSSQMAEDKVYKYPFKKFHKNQYLQSVGISRARSSGSRAASIEAIQRQNQYLGDTIPPSFAIIFRIVRTDRTVFGYQVAGYMDKATKRVQVILSSLAANDNWKMSVDGVLLSMHKVAANVAWGADGKEYGVAIKAETGIIGPSPAVRVELEWLKLPTLVTIYGKRLTEYIPRGAEMAGFIVAKAANGERQIELTVALPTKKTIDIIIRIPQMTISRLGVPLPFALPFERDGTLPEDIVDSVQNMLYEATSAKCAMIKNKLTTFNNRRYKSEMPISCYNVLAQDCTPELKFMVLMKKDDNSDQNHLNVKIADIDVDLYPMGSEVLVKINGMEVPASNLPYQHPSGTIQTKKNAGGLSLYAPRHGLQEVYFSKDGWRIQVVDWMKGQTCGLCGKADGEIRQEFRTPSGYLTKSPVSFAHSWVLPAESCRDATQCRMRLESVKLEKQMIVDGQESKCYSVEPVLRCLPGCYPERTSLVNVGYHCVPIDSNLNLPDILSNTDEKRVDLRETAEAHVACRCTEQCA